MTIKEWFGSITTEDVQNFWLRVRESAIFSAVSTAIVTGLSVGYQALTESGSLDIFRSQDFWYDILYVIVVSFLASLLMGANRVRRHVKDREVVTTESKWVKGEVPPTVPVTK